LVGFSCYRDEGHSIPVILSHEIDIELSCPAVGYILFFLMFGTNRTVNMMAYFVEEDLAEKHLTEKKCRWRSLNPPKNLANAHTVSQRSGTLRYRWISAAMHFEEMK